MIQRPHHKQLVVFANLQCSYVIQTLPRHVGIGMHHPLRTIGRPAGVHQAIDVFTLRITFGRIFSDIGRTKSSTVNLCRLINQYRRNPLGHRGAKLIIGEEQSHTGMLRYVADLVCPQPIVDRKKHRVDTADGK
ncbi:hypothetical protein D3C87_1482020 [compost metagenome]